MLRFGSNDLEKRDESVQIVEIIQTYRHPKFQEDKGYSDVGLMEIEPIVFGWFVRPICLPDPTLLNGNQSRNKDTTQFVAGLDLNKYLKKKTLLAPKFYFRVAKYYF